MPRANTNESSKRPRNSSNKENGSRKKITASNGWYSARLLFVAKTDGRLDADPLCEESIIVLRAADETGAAKQARRQGMDMAHSYKNEAGEVISWKFLGVLGIQDLCENALSSGSEVYSHLFLESQTSADEARSLIDKCRTAGNGRGVRQKC